MPAEESSPAIVLRARDYSESDRIVTLLTRDFGKLGGIAKGAKASRRRFERKLEPFSCVTLFFRRRPLGQLVFITRAEPGPMPQPVLEDDLRKIALGSYMVELADALTREEADAAAAYNVLAAGLAVLGRGPATAALRSAYDMKMLRAAGFGLEFDNCRICRSRVGIDAAAAYFVISRGGIVCMRCRSEAPQGAVRLDASGVLALSKLGGVELGEAADLPSAGAAAGRVLTQFLGDLLDRKLRSVEFLDSVL
ncbi:MAG TPA: DNA repair protein RecO [Candidatus Binataceae bacterium]|nr:DNA repair protein RecO [Candidatus Binataceae bacterium]